MWFLTDLFYFVDINQESEHLEDPDADLSDPFSSDDDVLDPHYSAESSPNSSDENDVNRQTDIVGVLEEINENDQLDRRVKSRKRKSQPEAWHKNKVKRLRNSGKAYVSCSKSRKVFQAKKLGPPCDAKCRLNCPSKILQEIRQIIFEEYWGLADLEKQRCFLSANIDNINPKYRYVRENSNRSHNHAFYFTVYGQRHRVCKFFFKSTLSISDRPIRTIIKKRTLCAGGMITSEMRGKHGKHQHVDDGIKQGIREHILSIPKIESHYCRRNSSKEYIEGGRSLADIHRDYIEICKSRNQPYANYLMFSRVFNNEFNIGFHSPKKDQCETCIEYVNASENEKPNLIEKYEQHLKEKDLAREEKLKDKQDEFENTVTAVYDLQAVMQCPRGDVSSFYYTSKLNVFNFTIYEMKSNKAQCFVWDECEANRGVCEIGTCVLKYIQSLEVTDASQIDERKLDLIFYSDNCCGQQKNRFMFAMYLYVVQNLSYINSITHKYLIKGHSQNEGDSVHATIERQIKRALKSGPIYVPDQYVTLIRTAKKTGEPYNVQELSYDSVYDLKALVNLGLQNLKNENNELVKIGDLKVVRFVKNENCMFYKTSYEQKEFQKLELKPTRGTRNQTIQYLQKLYRDKPKLNVQKKASILSLFKKNSIPNYYFNFYNNL